MTARKVLYNTITGRRARRRRRNDAVSRASFTSKLATPKPINVPKNPVTEPVECPERVALKAGTQMLFDFPPVADAARGAHAAALARRVRRPSALCSEPGRALRPRDRTRCSSVDDSVGSARHRKDDARRDHRALNRRALRTDLGGERRRARSCGASSTKRRFARRVRQARRVLFIDEIHRFNKAQQDAVLPYVEDGTVTLIGATTENPSFEVNSALLSRARVFVLEALSDDEIGTIVDRALADAERGLGRARRSTSTTTHGELLDRTRQRRRARGAQRTRVRGGNGAGRNGRAIDARRGSRGDAAARRAYDKGGETHYDTISAFIKSVRASDPDAALYWLAR